MCYTSTGFYLTLSLSHSTDFCFIFSECKYAEIPKLQAQIVKWESFEAPWGFPVLLKQQKKINPIFLGVNKNLLHAASFYWMSEKWWCMTRKLEAYCLFTKLRVHIWDMQRQSSIVIWKQYGPGNPPIHSYCFLFVCLFKNRLLNIRAREHVILF